MSTSIPDIDDLSVDDLKKLVLQLFEEVSALRAENAAQAEEIARLKGLKGRPKIRPIGMERAPAAQPAGGKGRQAPARRRQAGGHRGAGDHDCAAAGLAVQGL